MAIAPRVSVLIPTRQRRALLHRALLALGRQTAAPDVFEVIVAVNGASDGTPAMLASLAPAFRLRAIEVGAPGRASALNAALACATGEVVVFLDDDMEATPGFVDAHARAHEAAERLGIVGAAPIARGAHARLAERYVAERFDRHLRKLAQLETVGPGDFYSGNFSVRRSVVAALGGFDGGYTTYGNEDRDLAVRLIAAGVVLRFSADATALQRYTKGARELLVDHFEKGRSAVRFRRVHGGEAGDTPFRSYRGGSLARRAVRAGLLAAGAAWAGCDRIVPSTGRLLEQHEPPGALRLLAVLLDYAFWRGVAAAEREDATS
jgi:glycosyltransferase involved in cell wall biosynthesis